MPPNRSGPLPERHSAELVEVIRITFLRGSGTGPDDVMREVVQFWSIDGILLAEVDPSPMKFYHVKTDAR